MLFMRWTLSQVLYTHYFCKTSKQVCKVLLGKKVLPLPFLVLLTGLIVKLTLRQIFKRNHNLTSQVYRDPQKYEAQIRVKQSRLICSSEKNSITSRGLGPQRGGRQFMGRWKNKCLPCQSEKSPLCKTKLFFVGLFLVQAPYLNSFRQLWGRK